MVNPFALTIDAIMLTFKGVVPLEIWFPLFEDIVHNLGDRLADILEVLL